MSHVLEGFDKSWSEAAMTRMEARDIKIARIAKAQRVWSWIAITMVPINYVLAAILQVLPLGAILVSPLMLLVLANGVALVYKAILKSSNDRDYKILVREARLMIDYARRKKHHESEKQ